MAVITSFKIRGLAGRPEIIGRPLRPDVNVFWGFNGSGKTSLLKILHSALRGDATSILRVPFADATVTIADDQGHEIVRHLDKSMLPERRMEQVAVDDEEGMLRLWSVGTGVRHRTSGNIPWDTMPSEEAAQSFPHGYLPISRVSESRFSRTRARLSIGELIDEAAFDKLFAEQIRSLWKEYNQRATAQINRAQDRGLAQILGLVLSASVTRPRDLRPRVVDAETAFEVVKAFLATQRVGRMIRVSKQKFMDNYESDKLAQEVVAEAAQIQRSVERALDPQHQVERLISDLYAGSKQLEFRGEEVVVRVGDDVIPLESLSSGEKQLLQILLECLAAGRSPILVDEPELSLHVDWQNRLVENMRTVNSGAQLILATHSPEVMANLADHHIFEL